MAVEAVRYREEADLAARVAAHRARLARMAHEAASMAAEAARAASQGSRAQAAQLIEEARQIEETLLAEADKDDSELPPVALEPSPGFAPPSPESPRRDSPPVVAPPTTTGPAFAGAAAGLTTAHASIGGALPLPPQREPLERISHPPPAPPMFPTSPPLSPSLTAPPLSAPPPAASVPPPRGPAYTTNPPQAAFTGVPIPPEYSSNSRIRPTVVPMRLSPWEQFYRREVLGFPAPVALVLAAVLLTSVIAAIAMLVR